MGINADIKRIFFTTTACFVVSALCFSIPNNNINSLSPLLFTLAVILTNSDRLKIESYKAVLLGLILSLAIFFIAVLSVIGLSGVFGKHSILFCSPVAAALMFLTNSLYLKMGSFKVGLAVTAILAFLTLPVLEELRRNFPNLEIPIALAVDPNYFFLCWQTLAALGISIGIWLKIQEMPAPNTV